MEKDQLRPLYSEFQGYLSQAPEPKALHEVIDDDAVWNQYNHSVDLLNEISQEDFSRFKIQPQRGSIVIISQFVTFG